jgi:hypothetical protein
MPEYKLPNWRVVGDFEPAAADAVPASEAAQDVEATSVPKVLPGTLKSVTISAWIGTKCPLFKLPMLMKWATGKKSKSTTYGDTFHEIAVTMTPDQWTASPHKDCDGIFHVKTTLTAPTTTFVLFIIDHGDRKTFTRYNEPSIKEGIRRLLCDKQQ